MILCSNNFVCVLDRKIAKMRNNAKWNKVLSDEGSDNQPDQTYDRVREVIIST